MRELYTTPAFDRDIQRVPKLIATEAKIIIPELCKNPTNNQLGVKQLVNVRGNIYRARIDEYRLIYSFTAKTVILKRLAHRSKVYFSL
jgi:mRNA-degrading endonuclease RelE of RelBE toxin-antitoxin system